MKKKISSFIIGSAFLLNSFISPDATQAAPKDISIFMDNQKQQYDEMPFIKDGRALVPFRGIFESFESQVNWDPSSKTVSASGGNTQIALIIGSNQVVVNGKTITIDVPAQIKNGRTFVPLRFVSESLNGGVSWDSQTKAIYITKQKPNPVQNNNGILAEYKSAVQAIINQTEQKLANLKDVAIQEFENEMIKSLDGLTSEEQASREAEVAKEIYAKYNDLAIKITTDSTASFQTTYGKIATKLKQSGMSVDSLSALKTSFEEKLTSWSSPFSSEDFSFNFEQTQMPSEGNKDDFNNNEQPTKPSAESIMNKYYSSFKDLETESKSQLEDLKNEALTELTSGKDLNLMDLVDKYTGKAESLEAQVDSKFDSLYSSLEGELEANGYSATEAESYKEMYEVSKDTLEDSLFNQLN